MQPLSEPPAGPHAEEHVVPWTVYVLIFAALCVLTVTTVVAASFNFGPLNVVVALGIAIAKASLVVLYFMHARYSPRLTGIVIAAALGFFVILVFLTWTDYYSRSWPLTTG